FDEIFPSGDITTHFRDAAARVFDQAARNDIRTGFDRLTSLHKFAVAVVHENYDFWIPFLNFRNHRFDLADSERFPHTVTSQIAFDESFASGDITTHFRDAAARVFDQAARNDIRTGFDRLTSLHKFAVAVVHENYDFWIPFLNFRNHRFDLADSERFPHTVTS